MGTKLQSLSPAEWQLLQLVYRLEPPVSLHEVSGQTDQWQYSTVQTLLNRVARKGWLAKETAGKRLSLYSPVLSFEQAVEARLRELLERDFLGDSRLAEHARRSARTILGDAS